ncbi:unnamed protein product [Angiostrongylus costaricensis]|uniref:COX assembly mitochondrial protein n=1 Tax=Angiostrongylus costaricensis TaxID=334426 RepID=A0A0R3PWZ1_ANGCS|nr:unnamed protein product [Angiostrongylus costaricensis]
MGSSQSQEEPDVVRISRSEVPDEYNGDLCREELAREREEKLRMREEMARLSELQQRTLSTPLNSSADFEERKRIFDETVERVQSRFFAYHRENVCANNEKEIMSCLMANPGRILKCAHLAENYEKCISDFQQEVLNGK